MRSSLEVLFVAALFAHSGMSSAAATNAVTPNAARAHAESRGTSALDAWAAYRDAEERSFRLVADRVTRFECRVRCPFVEKLADPGGPLAGKELVVRLSWEAPDRPETMLVSGVEGLAADEIDRIQMLFSPLHELVLPERPSLALARHEFRFVTDAEGSAPGEVVIEARAREEGDPRRRVRFTVGADGLVHREYSERRSGEVSDFEYEHAVVAGKNVMTACHGWWHGQNVGIEITWGAQVAGRPVPTRIIVRQLDPAGQPYPGMLGETRFDLSDFVVNGVR